MKMHYGFRILIGLMIFLGLLAFPLWYNAGGEPYKTPEDKLPTEAQVKAAGYSKLECVESKEYMRTTHMKLLDDWRDYALRDGERTYVSSNGNTYAISLQNGCMKCHTNKAEFCDKCHDATSVSPYCWDCHIQPEGLKDETH